MNLLLFDIDGTLLRAHGVGRRAMERAGQRLLGPSFSLDDIDFGGALDPWIFAQAAARCGKHDCAALHDDFHESYLLELAAELARGELSPRILPGVAETLARLAHDARATLGLVTGNYTRAAPLKLRACGIDPVQFVLGAFGEDAPTRPELVRIALQRFAARGHAPDPRRVVVIGDTPRDVDCAKQNGCWAVAVTTGFHAREPLEAAGADVVLDDLTQLAGALERLLTA